MKITETFKKTKGTPLYDPKELVIRNMYRDDMELALRWASKEGWNPGLYDAEAYYNTDPEGFFMAELHGEPVGCISAVQFSETFGFLGLFIVVPEHRGKGLGKELWNRAMVRLGHRNIGTEVLFPYMEAYKSSGFKFARKNIRYKGITHTCQFTRACDLHTVDFDELVAYDKKIFFEERRAFLDSWINLPESKALGFVQDNKLVGYGVIRRCVDGFKIGPLYADTKEYAEQIFCGLVQYIPGENFTMDVPEENETALAIAESHHMEVVFESARMYSRLKPDIPIKSVYAVSTLDLG